MTRLNHQMPAVPNGGQDRQGVARNLPVHNFSHDVAYFPRIVLVGIGGGVALPFTYFPFLHSAIDSHSEQPHHVAR